MYTIIVIVIIAVICGLIYKYIPIEEIIKFYVTGFDAGFQFSEIKLLWKLAQIVDLEEPRALFWSVAAIDKSIAAMLKASKMNGTDQTPVVQKFIDRLYEYKTQMELKQTNSKKGLLSSRHIAVNTKIRVVYKQKGVFFSKVLNNARHLVIDMPLQENMLVSTIDWKDQPISIFFWRDNDAAYSFDTYVVEVGPFRSKNVLFLKHTDQIYRSQKRKSIRSDCCIKAQLYLKSMCETPDNTPEIASGLMCIVENISQDGALIRAGGRAESNLELKLQFALGDTTIVMIGTVRSVEYISETNQSKLHFEAQELPKSMKNAVLSYVYNFMSTEEKEKMYAIALAEKDAGIHEDGVEESILQLESALQKEATEKEKEENQKADDVAENKDVVEEPLNDGSVPAKGESSEENKIAEPNETKAVEVQDKPLPSEEDAIAVESLEVIDELPPED